MTVPLQGTATVLICTFNRRELLRQTLDSLAQMEGAPAAWDVVVVDNNSTDGTAGLVAARASSYPVPLRCVRESRQGKSHALNTGLAATAAAIVAFTDDDVIVPRAWLREAILPMLERPAVDYTGGPVRAIWGGPRPAWLPAENSNLWGTIAALDYGPEPFIFEERRRIPIGANMAVRRSVFDRAGMFDPALGRRGDSLLGQEQAEFFHRTRRHGIQGLYVPTMVLDHHVPAARLTRRYFRRWWYWKGVSRARLHRLHPETETGLDLRTVPRFSGVPRFVLGEMAAHARGLGARLLRGDRTGAAEEEMMLVYSFGYFREAWRTRREPAAGGGASASPEESRLAGDPRP